MPTYEFFDRLASDLTLSDIIAARMKKKVWARIARRAGAGWPGSTPPATGPFDPAIAEKLRKLRLSLTNTVKPKPPVTHMKRSVLLKRITEFNARLDRIIYGEKEVRSQRSEVRDRKVTEFAFLPAVVGGVLGSGVGAAVGKKKWNPETGKWEDSPVTSAAGAVAGAGAGYGLGKAHDTLLKNYGGEGGVKEAYRNVARNVGRNVTDVSAESQQVRDALAGSFKAAQKTKLPFGASMGYAKDIAGGSPLGATGHVLGDLAKRLKNLKGAGTRALTKVFADRKLPRGFVEFESRIDAIVFKRTTDPASEAGRDKKKVELMESVRPRTVSKGGTGASRLQEFARAAQEQPKKKFLTPGKAFVAGVAALPLAGAAVAAAGPGRHLLAGAREALQARRVRNLFPPGSNIPPHKVADFLRMLHAGKIKVA